MPITFKHIKMAAKDPVSKEYITFDTVSDGTTAERVAAIEAAGAEQLAQISSATNGFLKKSDIDSSVSASSENPVQNKAVKYYVDTAISNINTMEVHICSINEYNAETGIPIIQNPNSTTFYLVPGGASPNLYIEWVYINNVWEQFGSASVEFPVSDVQVDGTSIVSDGTANILLSEFGDNLIAVQEEEPTDEENKIWFDSDAIDEITIPTSMEFEQLSDSVTDISNDIDSLVIVSDEEPAEENNKIWVDSDSGEDITVLTSSDLDELNTAINRQSNEITGKLDAPATAGTNGQVLTSDGNGGQSWQTVPAATDAQVAEAVTDWLDENVQTGHTLVIDSSLTVQGAAADAKIVGDALAEHDEKLDHAVIKLTTNKSEYHSITPSTISFYPDSRLIDVTAKYSQSQNVLSDYFQSGTNNGITRTKNGNLINLSGTGTGQFFIVSANSSSTAFLNSIKGKTFYLYALIQKGTTWNAGGYIQFYDGVGVKKFYYNTTTTTLIGWNDFGQISISENATSFSVKFDSLEGETFTAGDCVWIGMYETALTETNHLVTGEDPYTISVSGIDGIDTATHESTVGYVMDTKTYVDNHIPDIKAYWTEEIYALPENFGAVGDGATDDTHAISDCIAYAKSNSKAVRGFGTYKTSQTIPIDGRYLDVYLREIKYTGDSTAIEIVSPDVVFNFHTIESGGIGLSFGHITGSSASRCQVKGNRISSTSHCVEVKNSTYYSTCEVRFLTTKNGNCINRNTEEEESSSGEFVFRSSSCHCPNGWVSYRMGSSKFYDFTIEQDCKYGFLNPSGCTCVGCRHVEQSTGIKYRVVDGNEAYTNGPLFKFETLYEGLANFKYIGSVSPVFWFNFDLSEYSGYARIPNGTGSVGKWQELGWKGDDIGVAVTSYDENSRKIMGVKSYIIGGHLVLEPGYRTTSNIDVDTVNFTLFDNPTDENIVAARNLPKYLGTDFIIDVTHTNIYFNAYFGAIGYNDITITQRNGNTATIYDKLGNVLFDGTNEGDGKWHLHCIVDRSSFGRYDGTTEWWLYDGTNEIWEITKVS